MGKKKEKTVKQHQLYTANPKVWKKLQAENVIDKRYKDRARNITHFTRFSYPLQLLQKIIYNKKINSLDLSDTPPVFILGLWRSGTTHLHYMLARDPQFGYLTNYQAFIFNMAFLSKTVLRKISYLFVPKKRLQDNVKLSPDEPAEEEQPFSTMSPYAGINSFWFPRNTDYFKKYNLFQGISEKEKLKWQKHYLFLLKSIALFSGKNKLVLKNPHSTGRVKELLELFPEAKIIFIHRNPYVVYQSNIHMYHKMVTTQFLQEVSNKEIELHVLENIRDTVRKYIDEKHLIPEGNLVEISFQELESDAMGTLSKIYADLNLPGLSKAKQPIENYLKSVKNYKKNKFEILDSQKQQQIDTELDFYFKQYGYKKGELNE